MTPLRKKLNEAALLLEASASAGSYRHPASANHPLAFRQCSQIQLLVLVVNDFEEEHSAKLLEALGIARDALFFIPHDIADVSDDGGNVGH